MLKSGAFQLKSTVLFFAFFIGFAGFSFSQDLDSDKNQAFVLSNFKIMKAYTNKDKSKLAVKFDLKMKNVVENYDSHPYYIDVFLESDNSKTIYSKNDVVSLSAKPDYSDKLSCAIKNVIIDIPYADIQIEEGRHYVNFVLSGRSDYKDFGRFFSVKIFIDKPQIFEYYDQEILLSNVGIEADNVQNRLKGLYVRFDYKLKFVNYQTRDFAVNDKAGQYLFYAKFYTKQNSTPVNFFAEQTGEFVLNAENLSGNIGIHIPYNKINIARGSHEILCEIYASNPDKTVNFGKIASSQVTYNQPVLYKLVLDVTSMTVKYSEGYDVSSFVGRIFSRKGSDAGKGYPDVFWLLKLGDYSEYRSSVNKNSFSLYPGKAISFITDDDPLSISCYDRDYTSFDDFIGTFKIENKYGNFTKKYNNIKFNNVENADFNVSKDELPYFKSQKIFVSNAKNKGVSGVFVETEFEIAALKTGDSIIVKPIVQNSQGSFEITDFIDSEYSGNRLRNCGGNGKYKIFVPYAALTNDSKVGFDILSASGEIKFPQIVFEKPIFIPEINDTKLLSASINDEEFEGIHGVNFTLLRDIPDYYADMSGQLLARIKIYSEPNLIIDTLVYIDKFNPKQSSFFIPYYKIQASDIIADEIITAGNDTYVIGKSRIAEKNHIKALSEVKIKALSVYFDDDIGLKNAFFVLKYDNKPVYRSKNSSVNKNTEIVCNDLIIRAFADDELLLTVLGVYEYGDVTELFSEKIKVKDLLKGKKIKIKAYGILKKVVIH